MDSRFDTSSWSNLETQAGPSSRPFPSDQQDRHDLVPEDRESVSDEVSQDQEEEEEGEEGESSSGRKRKRLLSPSDQDGSEKKKRSKGIIYISRIPPGMTPPKVRHLLEGFGDVERLYLQDGREKERKRGNEGRGDESKSRSAHYTEGWVEFSSKRIAKLVASNLNAQPIGIIGGAGTGRKGKGSRGIKGREKSRWKDDIWTMKYLSGYKWEMLSSQLANERASHAARLRNELSQDAFEQKDYLKKVERARVEREKQEKKRKRNEKLGLEEKDRRVDGDGETSLTKENGRKNFTFKQRQPIRKDVRDRAGDGQSTSKKQETEVGVAAKGKRSKDSVGRSVIREVKSGVDSKRELNGVLDKIF